MKAEASYTAWVITRSLALTIARKKIAGKGRSAAQIT